jgi:hypothetical protein
LIVSGSLRGYFMTGSDNQAALVVSDVTPWVNRETGPALALRRSAR